MSELRIILKSRPEEKKKIFITIGEKLSKSRKSSRKKLEGIAKKLNFSPEMLKDIEAGMFQSSLQRFILLDFYVHLLKRLVVIFLWN